MSYTEDDLLPVSAIQHLLFCERQCALIHLERQWEENILTTEGHHLHERVDQMDRESRGDLFIARGLMIQSLKLGLAGRADVVEFHRLSNEQEKPADLHDVIRLSGTNGWWRIFPIEYKRGKPKPGMCDEAQLCAQAMCLEEVLNVSIEAGALFYNKTHHRKDVVFDPLLRQVVETAALRLHELIDSATTPPPLNDQRCPNCSLIGLCLPRCTSGKTPVRRYIDDAIRHLDGK